MRRKRLSPSHARALTEIQGQRTPTVNARSIKITTPTSKFDKMINEEDMQKAPDALDRQLIPDYAGTAKKFNLERTTLTRRHKGISTFRAEATSLYR
jgi:hypothetical protein